jgi:hypothetical protein
VSAFDIPGVRKKVSYFQVSADRKFSRESICLNRSEKIMY